MSIKRMMLWGAAALVAAALLAAVAVWYYIDSTPDTFAAKYQAHCASCHGEDLQGSGIGPALVGIELQYGESVEAIASSITNGYPARGMPPWGASIDDGTVRSLAIYVAEQRANRPFSDFKTAKALHIPTGVQHTEVHDFRLEVVATGIHALPFSIAPLPDGSLLVTEKQFGLRLVSPAGELSDYIQGTPRVHDSGIELGELEYGYGWMLDVAIHPDYAENGWIYLHYGDLCEDCGTFRAASMNKVVRGRIESGQWLNEEVIWEVPESLYAGFTDLAAGGRLAFDGDGFLYLSVGMMGPSNYQGIQDLSLPYGKIHRIKDDGRMPSDNPFRDTPNAWPSIWTYGHRSPQGLAVDPASGMLWGTEMGPRGGDEVNLLLPGRNYGWPLYSKGVNYDGSPVAYGTQLGIEFDLEDIEQPKVDLTPSPAVSSFSFYQGDAFPRWRDNMLIGTLKATQLYRVVVEGQNIVHTETLLQDLARIRDVETGFDGNVYLLLEHISGGQIIRLVPAGQIQPSDLQAPHAQNLPSKNYGRKT